MVQQQQARLSSLITQLSKLSPTRLCRILGQDGTHERPMTTSDLGTTVFKESRDGNRDGQCYPRDKRVVTTTLQILLIPFATINFCCGGNGASEELDF